MRFVDQCRVKVVAGDGGNGAVAFRREKFIPFGGPSGGDGGRGGNVILVGDEGLSTLLDFTHVRTIKADRGEHGQGKDCYGRAGSDRMERVPVGTQIRDHETGELLADVTEHGQKILVAAGGRGGRGNIHFATPHERAPRRAEKGEKGQTRELDLELKVMADVGLLGFPNVGKSTFVAAVSAARPKIADYPFTTLTPTLGVVEVGGGTRAGGTHFVIADIPGLIPGASEGVGLGIRFLKHVERTRALLHLVTLDPADGRSPLSDYRALRQELRKFSPELAARPEIVALSKADIPEVRQAYPELKRKFAKHNISLHLVSAATRESLPELTNELFKVVQGIGVPEVPQTDSGEDAEKAAKKAASKKAKAKKPTVAKKSAKKPVTKRAKPKRREAGATAPPKKTRQAKTPATKKAAVKHAVVKKRASKRGSKKKTEALASRTSPKTKQARRTTRTRRPKP